MIGVIVAVARGRGSGSRGRQADGELVDTAAAAAGRRTTAGAADAALPPERRRPPPPTRRRTPTAAVPPVRAAAAARAARTRELLRARRRARAGDRARARGCPGIGKSDTAGFGIANVLCLPTVSDWIWKSKSTPICSKKVSLHRDEPDLDRDLKVLEPAKLPQQVGDLLVHLGRVLDDQADAEEERHDRTGLPLLVDAAAGSPPKPPPSPVGRRHLVPVAVLDFQVPGAIDVVINCMIGDHSRPSGVRPWPLPSR